MPTLIVKVKPNAKRQKVDRAEDGSLVIYLQSPPVDGKANQELIELLSIELKIAKSRIHIRAGKTSRYKRVEIDEA